MAHFEEALVTTLKHEGGYVNDPDDRGKETYKGISRRHHPRWKGWRTVDDLKRSAGFPKNLDGNAKLQALVRSLYKTNYWDRVQGDAIRDDALAAELFDSAVNMGVARVVRFLQESLNILNRNESSYADIGVDGQFGPTTLKTLNKLLSKDRSAKNILQMIKVLQGMGYVEIVRREPIQEKYIRGWLKRI